MKINKKSVSPVIATMLVILIAVLGSLYLSNNIDELNSKIETQIKEKDINSIPQIKKVDDKSIFIYSDKETTFDKLEIEEEECLLNDKTLKSGLNEIKIGDCNLRDNKSEIIEIKLIYEGNIVKKSFFNKDYTFFYPINLGTREVSIGVNNSYSSKPKKDKNGNTYKINSNKIEKYNSTGNLIWSENIVNSASYLFFDSDENVYVAGSYSGSRGSGFKDVFFLKLNSNGTFQWRNNIVLGSQHNTFHTFYVDDYGIYISTRYTNFRAYDLNGNQIWSNSKAAESIASQNDGNVYFISSGGGESISKLNSSNGNVLWQKSHRNYNANLKVHQDFIYTFVLDHTVDELVFRKLYSSDGDIIYTKIYKAPGLGNVKIDIDGNDVYLVFSITQTGNVENDGRTFPVNSGDKFVIKMD